MRRVVLILAVATREEINQWTRRHRGRREITRGAAAVDQYSNLSDLISTQVAATVCAVNDDGDGDKNLGYDGSPDAVWDEHLGDYVYPDAKGYDYGYDYDLQESVTNTDTNTAAVSSTSEPNATLVCTVDLGERAPGSAAEIAELSVWALKKALHVAEIDTALMEDITFAFINGLYMKLRGGE